MFSEKCSYSLYLVSKSVFSMFLRTRKMVTKLVLHVFLVILVFFITNNHFKNMNQIGPKIVFSMYLKKCSQEQFSKTRT